MPVPHDPTWTARFEDLAEELRTHGDPRWEIEHIGSTSIPGMPAKPIIDLAVRVSPGDLDRHASSLEAAGWRFGSSIVSHPVMIRVSGDVREAIAHFFPTDEWEAAAQRILRDWLRTHPADAALYSRAKQDAVLRAEGGESYSAAKTAVIQEIMDRARIARGLPPVQVGDKSPTRGETP